VLVLSACQSERQVGVIEGSADVPTEQKLLRVYGSYADVPIDEQIRAANIIFAGTVTDISKTRWNQDSGEYWEEVVKSDVGETIRTASQYYTIKLIVDRAIVDAKEGQELTVTVAGSSPMDPAYSVDESSEYKLSIGAQVVMFVRHSELAWRNGVHPILQLMSAPDRSYFIRGKDGLYRTAQLDMQGGREKPVSLDELVVRIDQIRSK